MPDYCADIINWENIVSVKKELEEEKLLEPVLNANLDYAMRALGGLHPTCLRGATLLVEGARRLVKIWDRYTDKMQFTVTSLNGCPQLQQRVVCGKVIEESDINDIHFFGHRCQDQKNCCMDQVKEVVRLGQRYSEIRIVCNKLFLSYTTNEQDDHPIFTIKTECKLAFPVFHNFGDLLQIRRWLMEEKPEKKGLIACMDFLLSKYASNVIYPQNFFLQSEGDMVEIFCPSPCGDRFFYSGSQGVSMFPQTWKNEL